MGRKYSNIAKYASNLSYKVTNELGNPHINVKYRGQNLSLNPVHISSQILTYAKTVAEEYLGKKVTHAVITVPSYFGVAERKATRQAAKEANIDKVYIINEPTAAALAFQHRGEIKGNKKVLVYDFGGGTFDVSILDIGNSYCNVLSTDGDCFLGGADVNNIVYDHIVSKITEDYKKEPFKTKLHRLKDMAIKAKEDLTTTAKVYIDCVGIIPSSEDDEEYMINIDDRTFNAFTEHLYKKSLHIVHKCLHRANLTAKDVDDVILIGGSSRIRRVGELLKQMFGEKINKTVSPDEDVAYGAAIYASLMFDGSNVVQFKDVLSSSLGTDVKPDKLSIIVMRNTPIPCEKRKGYTTVEDYQSHMSITIYQGDNEKASENFILGEFSITDLTRAQKGCVTVYIVLSIDAEGILIVTAFEKNNENNRRELKIDEI